MCQKEVVPGITAAQADNKIVRSQAEPSEDINQERQQFGVRRSVAFPNDIPPLGSKQLQSLPTASIILTETVTARDGSPRIENVLPGIGTPHFRLRQRFRVKISKTRQSFHSNA